MMRRALLLLCLPYVLHGYSVLSHEAIVDSAWDNAIRPLLLQRFPNATADELRKAHGYAYGGSIIQDMGYYPFGTHLFSDLTHYVRSGDFVMNMLASAEDLDEYAFALGAMAHYAADNTGHPIAVNRSVPMLYPKVRRKFGAVATYEDNPRDHLKMEFAFDVSQVAEQHYAPESYHAFIGFEVAQPLLERAFEATYGLPLKDVSKNLELALGTYRWTISSLMPEITRAAWNEKKKEILKDNPRADRRQFVYDISRASYEKEWGRTYSHPGLGARILSFLLRIIPKIGPFSSLSFRPATPEAQKLFMDSFVKCLALYKQELKDGALQDTNFDTGEPSHTGQYRLADDASGKLLLLLDKKNFAGVDEKLRGSLMAFYGSSTPGDAHVAAALAGLRQRRAAAN